MFSVLSPAIPEAKSLRNLQALSRKRLGFRGLLVGNRNKGKRSTPGGGGGGGGAHRFSCWRVSILPVEPCVSVWHTNGEKRSSKGNRLGCWFFH